MKTILKSSLYFYIVFLLGLLPFFGCGEDVTPSEGFRTSSEGFRFPSGASGPLWELSDAYIAELLKLDIPSNWAWMDIDKETYNKYYHAQLLKQFSDIPEVRYLIAYSLHPGDKTREQIIAKSEVLYRLFPNEETLKSLQQTIALPDPTNPEYSSGGAGRDPDEWMTEDPEGYMAHMEVVLLRRYGDIPEVHTYVRLELKRLLGKKLTEAEREARNGAFSHLINLDKLDEAPDG